MKRLIALILCAMMLSVVGCAEKTDDTLKMAETAVEPGGVEDAPAPAEVLKETGVAETPDVAEVSGGVEEGSNESIGEPGIEEEEIEEIENREVITIFQFAPHPEDLEIKVGTTVTWVNEDENFQHIIGWTKMPVRPGVIPPGAQWNHTFTEPGEIIWYSTPKPTVQGTITITE